MDVCSPNLTEMSSEEKRQLLTIKGVKLAMRALFLQAWGQVCVWGGGAAAYALGPCAQNPTIAGAWDFICPLGHPTPEKTHVCSVAFLRLLYLRLFCLCPVQVRGLMAEVRGLRKDFSRVPPPHPVLARQGTSHQQRTEGEQEGRKVELNQVIHQTAPDGSGNRRVGVLQNPGGSSLSCSLSWVFLQIFLPTPRQHSISLPAKEALGGPGGERRMDAYVGVYRDWPARAAWEEQRILQIQKLPTWELATLTKKEPTL